MAPQKWKLAVPAMLLSLAVFAQDRPDARDLLARASGSLFSAKTVRVALTRSHGFAGGFNPATPFQTAFVRGGRGRAEWFFPIGSGTITLMVFDGKDLWEYHQMGNQYTQKAASAWTVQGEFETLDYGRNPNSIAAASYENDETINFNGHAVLCWVVRADYRGAPENRMGKDVVRRVWISKSAELILRDYWEGPLEPALSNVKFAATTNYTAIETDIPLPDDLFVFHPPPGSHAGEPMVLGGILGGIPTSVSPPPPARPVEGTGPPQRIQVSESVQRARLLRHTEPVYPALARQARIEGIVKLGAFISKDGTIQNLQVVSGHPLLIPAALNAVKQWVYEPTVVNGEAVEVATQIEVSFTLK